jgi:phage-related protein
MAIGRIIGRVAIKVIPDTSGFREDVKTDLNGREKPAEVKVRVIPEIDRKDLDKVHEELKRWAARISPIQVNVAPDIAGASAKVVSARLKALTHRRDVQIVPDLNEAGVAKVVAGLSALSGFRAVAEMSHEFREELMNLDKAVPKIGLVSHALAGLATFALTAGGNIFSLTNSIAEMGLAGLALPGIIGGIAVGLGITVTALKDFNKEVPKAAGYLHKLQDVISQNFWDKAAGPIRNLVDELFPALITMTSKTASALGGFFANLANSLSGKLLPDLGPMFDNLNKSIAIFGQHTDSIANIIAVLGSLGSKYLPQLAAWFGQITDQFSNWLTASDQAGKLTSWVDQGVTQIKAFAGVITGLVGTLHGLGEAAQAAGGSTLQTLAAGLQRASDVANSPAFQGGLTDTLRAAYDMMNQIGTIAGPALKDLILSLSQSFQKLGPTIGDTLGTAISAIASALASPAISNGLAAMFTGFNTMVHDLAPAMQPLADKIGMIGQVVGALAANIGGILAAAITTLAPIITNLGTALIPVINMLGPIITKIITDLGPVFATLGTQIGNVITALQPLLTQVSALWNLISPVLIPALQFLAEVIGSTIVMAINGVTNIIAGLVTFITGVVEVIKGIFTGDFAMVWQGLKDMIGGAVQAIWGAIETYIAVGALKLFKAAFDGIIAFGKSFAPNLKSVLSELWSSILGRIRTAWQQIETVPQLAFQAILSLIRGIVGDIKAAWSLIWDNLPSVVSNMFGNVKSLITGLPGKIKGWLGDTGSILKDAGKAIIQGLIDGISSMFGAVKDKLGDLTSKLTSWKGPEPVDRVLLTPAGELIIAGLIKGFESQFDAVKDSLGDLTSEIANYVGKSMSEEISKALSISMAQSVGTTIKADAVVAGGNISSQLGALEAQITKAWADRNSTDASKAESISIGNITIPLEDLKQLKDLQEFLDLLRVRTRQGAA